MRGRQVLLGVGTLVIAVGAILAVAISSQASPEVLPAEVLSETRLIPPGSDTSLRLDPPAADFVPALTADEALTAAGKLVDPSEAASIKATLALFTNPTYRPVTPDGEPTGPPFWVDVPVWLITIDGVCAGGGGGGFILPEQAPRKLVPCTNREVNIVIDATTGKYLMDISYR